MRAEFIATALGLAVVWSTMRLWLTAPAQQASPVQVARPLLESSSDARSLMEELRLLRDDIGRLETAIHAESTRLLNVTMPRPPEGLAEGPGAVEAPSDPQIVHQVPLVSPADWEGARDGSLLLSVITNPSHFAERAKLREYYRRNFSDVTANGDVRVVFVVGRNFFLGNPPKPMSKERIDIIRRLSKESDEFGDIVWTDGREGLPHVGKATEKSAAFWQTAPNLGKYGHYCKSDDDSLIHLRCLACRAPPELRRCSWLQAPSPSTRPDGRIPLPLFPPFAPVPPPPATDQAVERRPGERWRESALRLRGLQGLAAQLPVPSVRH